MVSLSPDPLPLTPLPATLLFLLTFEKIGTPDGDRLDARKIEVFKLITVTKLSESSGFGNTLPGVTPVELEYEQIF